MASDFARQLRRDLTDAERCLWKHLRAHRFAGDPVCRDDARSPLANTSWILSPIDHGWSSNSTADSMPSRWSTIPCGNAPA